MSDISMSYELEERTDGWFFRFPENDEAAQWRGPYSSRSAADDAVMKHIESYLAESVLEAFQLN